MKIVQEFYARGFEFLKIDLYQSDAIKFQVVEDKLLPPFSVIEGMGGIAAEALAVAAHAETEDVYKRQGLPCADPRGCQQRFS